LWALLTRGERSLPRASRVLGEGSGIPANSR
jgi:hypothetical protein